MLLKDLLIIEMIIDKDRDKDKDKKKQIKKEEIEVEVVVIRRKNLNINNKNIKKDDLDHPIKKIDNKGGIKNQEEVLVVHVKKNKDKNLKKNEEQHH